MISKYPGELQTIQEVVQYCRDIAFLQPDKMPKEEQEREAAGIMGLLVNDRIDEWEELYPELLEVLNFASDLEWSNENPYHAWPKIRELLAQLDSSLNK